MAHNTTSWRYGPGCNVGAQLAPSLT